MTPTHRTRMPRSFLVSEDRDLLSVMRKQVQLKWNQILPVICRYCLEVMNIDLKQVIVIVYTLYTRKPKLLIPVEIKGTRVLKKTTKSNL